MITRILMHLALLTSSPQDHFHPAQTPRAFVHYRVLHLLYSQATPAWEVSTVALPPPATSEDKPYLALADSLMP